LSSMEVGNAPLLNYWVLLRPIFNTGCLVWKQMKAIPETCVTHRLGEVYRLAKWGWLWFNTCQTLRSQIRNQSQLNTIVYDGQKNNTSLIQRAEEHRLWRFYICFQC
jgi:hypothetical protein